ncbi:Zinc finger, CHY-type [Dillenia turbinata]|uniref:Zinc finger, CHY-type n=1 Tax=Dillenia turbinata TaxID=194707 RepID=A0AAN8Z4X5_9MAGN
MSGADSYELGSGTADPPIEASPETSNPGFRLVDAPILLFVVFHKALRAELNNLRNLSLTSAENGRLDRELIDELKCRFEFLKLFYKYHCASEDEVIFPALNENTKNVVCAYSLEHESIDGLFNSIFHCLGDLTEDTKKDKNQFQELIHCIGTIQKVICQHMLKEEEQVIPLMMQKFSPSEQASLVWQSLCSVPIMLLEDFLPWIISFITPDEQVDVVHCIKEVVPKEDLLQEVVISWLRKKNQPWAGTNHGKADCVDGPASAILRGLPKLHMYKRLKYNKWKQEKVYFLWTENQKNPFDGISLWHAIIKKELEQIVEELHQMRISKNFSSWSSVVVQLKFLADVIIFYSIALDKIFYPVLNDLSDGSSSSSKEMFSDRSLLESLQHLLNYIAKTGIPSCEFVEKLHQDLESLMTEIIKNLAFQQTEVFPLLSKNCSCEMQQWLLYRSLHMLPLGLLKCVITWFSTSLTEEMAKSILSSIKKGIHLVDKTFASLLHEWFHTGYSGKTSTKRFREMLQGIFKCSSSFLYEKFNDNVEAYTTSIHSHLCKSNNSGELTRHAADKTKNNISQSSSSGSCSSAVHVLYSSKVNMHIFLPGTTRLWPILKCNSGNVGAGSTIDNEPRPVDHIFFFHKALRKDLESLVSLSSEMGENMEFLWDFQRQFQLVRFLYQVHSDLEDTIAFPALEAKGELQLISHSYTIDHKLEIEQFDKLSSFLEEISQLCTSDSAVDLHRLASRTKYRHLCLKIHDDCKSIYKLVSDHVDREEVELWPIFRECLSTEEQEKIIGCMLGRTRAEILQEMIPWLMASLSTEEQLAMMSLWLKATKNTMFSEWLREWWEGVDQYDIMKEVQQSNIPPSWAADPLKVVEAYLSKESLDNEILSDEEAKLLKGESVGADVELSGNCIVDDMASNFYKDQHNFPNENCTKFSGESEKKTQREEPDVTEDQDKQHQQVSKQFWHQENLLALSQEDLEAAIRRASRDDSLDPREKSYVIQNLIMSRWMIMQRKCSLEGTVSNNEVEAQGLCPSYRDSVELIFGCKHYKRNCKLLASCCNQLHACRYCHDDVSDHPMDRKSTTKMMCMKCLKIQLIGQTCSTVSCNNLMMAKYYCRICKLFDDEREIYHCPYCNLCRVGKGLGIDYFHCMNCNACMSRSLSVHVCREKCFEDSCPICHEYIFTSTSPVKALPCGHLMHSMCFQEYTCTSYTCPVCSKSLGDMQVYFGMLDALLADEKMPDEFSGQTQVILCNDCEKRGVAPFHWIYHKCPLCGSYNTRGSALKAELLVVPKDSCVVTGIVATAS